MFRPLLSLSLIVGVLLSQFACCCLWASADLARGSAKSASKVVRSCCHQTAQPNQDSHDSKSPKPCPCKHKTPTEPKIVEQSTQIQLAKWLLTSLPLLSSVMLDELVIGMAIEPIRDPHITRSGRDLLHQYQTFRC